MGRRRLAIKLRGAFAGGAGPAMLRFRLDSRPAARQCSPWRIDIVPASEPK